MGDVANILARHWADLRFINFEVILNELLVQGIIQHHEYFEIVPRGARKKLLFLQQYLPQKGDNAFPTFIRILREQGHGTLASQLEAGES